MIDLVLGGPDMSGTSTQIKDLTDYFLAKGLTVKDLGGTEIEALFHAELFKGYNSGMLRYKQFSDNPLTPVFSKRDFVYHANGLLMNLEVASCVENEISTYIDPDSADVWLMEEPTRRGAGQVCRTIEQNRSKFGDVLNPYSAAHAHQAYRTEEFLRFRKVFREKNKIILRSRSEESACYQVADSEKLPLGISKEDYLRLPGHQVAFSNPPTHLFIVCASPDWTREEYIELKKERSKGRILDDHEMNVDYQLLVNSRYASDWIENLYEQGCRMYNSKKPEIKRFDIYLKPDEVKAEMYKEMDKILKD